MASLPPKRLPGEVVNGRFLIDRELGAGAMGEVFLAHDGILDRDVAMKYLKWNPDKPALVEQFKSEFATLTHLSHPHITKVFDFAQDERSQQYFFTSEFIGGRDFFAFTANMAPRDIEALFVQALRALEYLHGNNIFHFDIKPQNVLVTGEINAPDPKDAARVQLIDFGLASLGLENKMIGTPSYMPPEIILCERPAGQADLYSLGVLIYYALTRWNPFRGSTHEETFSRHQSFTPPPPSSLNPKIPTYLDDMLLRLLAKRPEDRYASASQVIQDLNLRCGNRYPVETPETLLAYIPWEGQFIGRTKALRDFAEILKACREGNQERAPLIWVRGARGTGKSRLLREMKFAAQLAGHMTHIFDRADITSRVAWLAAIDSVVEDPAQPVVFFMDDAHTLIAERLAVEIVEGLRALVSQLRSQLQLGSTGQPVRALVVLSSLEDADSGTAIRNTLRLVANVARTVVVNNFSRDELHQYLATLTGLSTPPAALVDKLHDYTEGNPLFLTEVVKQLITHHIIIDDHGRWKATTFEDLGVDFQRLQVPPTVEAIVAQEYARLTPPEQDIAAALATWRKPITLPHLTALLGAPPSTDHLVGLTQKGLLGYDPATRQYAFRNITKQRAVYQQLGTAQRRNLHARAAAVLAEDPETSLEELYAHQGQTGAPETAAPALWELARHQLEVHRPHEAIVTLQQLMHLQQSEGVIASAAKPSGGGVEIRLALGRAYREARNYAAARATYDALIDPLKADPRQATRLAQVYEELGMLAMETHDYAAAEVAFMQALAIVHHATTDRVRRLRVENDIGRSQLMRGAVTEAIATFQRTASAVAELSIDERRQVTNNDLGQAYFEQGEYPRTIAQLDIDCAFCAEVGETPREMRSHCNLAQAHLMAHQYDRATAEYQRTLDLAKKCGDVRFLVNAYAGLGNVANTQKQLAEAQQYYERAVDLSGRLGDDELTATMAINLGAVCRQRGEHQKAENYFLSALAFLEQCPQKGELVERQHCTAHLELGELYRLQQHFHRAHHHIDEAWNLAARHANCAPLRFWIALTRVELFRDAGDAAKAREAMQGLADLAADDQMRHQVDETEKSLM